MIIIPEHYETKPVTDLVIPNTRSSHQQQRMLFDGSVARMKGNLRNVIRMMKSRDFKAMWRGLNVHVQHGCELVESSGHCFFLLN